MTVSNQQSERLFSSPYLRSRQSLKMKYSIGIDIGGTDIKAGLLAANGTLSCRTVVSTRVDEGAKAIAARIAQTIRQIVAAADMESHQRGKIKKKLSVSV